MNSFNYTSAEYKLCNTSLKKYIRGVWQHRAPEFLHTCSCSQKNTDWLLDADNTKKLYTSTSVYMHEHVHAVTKDNH